MNMMKIISQDMPIRRLIAICINKMRAGLFDMSYHPLGISITSQMEFRTTNYPESFKSKLKTLIFSLGVISNIGSL